MYKKHIFLIIFIVLSNGYLYAQKEFTNLKPCIADNIDEENNHLKTTVISSTKIIEVELSVCCIENAKRPEIYGTIEIKQKISGVSIVAYFDTNLDVIDLCEKQMLSEDHNQNIIKINNSRLALDNNLNGIDLSLFIPDRLFLITKDKVNYVIFEMYNFSYTTVGGGFTYIMIKMNESDEIDKYKIFEYKKEPMQLDFLSKKIDELF